MSRTYKATGINLKAMPLGEADRILTILTPDLGLIRAVAPGSRKHQSRLGGRSDLFVINDWLVAKGKRLDKVVQAETARTFPKLSQDLGRLTASQYLAEIVLFMALNDGSQADLYHLFVEHLERIEASPPSALLAALTHGLYHLLALAGVAPEVHRCCLSREDIVPNLMDAAWTVGFSPEAGGLVQWSAFNQGQAPQRPRPKKRPASVSDAFDSGALASDSDTAQAATSDTFTADFPDTQAAREATGSYRAHTAPPQSLNAMEVVLLQQLSKPEIITTLPVLPDALATVSSTQSLVWARIERLLRNYAQDYFERPIRSAALIDVCFATV
ncbi:DNA repair protein RecO [Leptolyngbya sp. BL0902]|uniref:DNA repair protein RecO n=1 Tax=Leptolyngbya sp. BL0902 TaxID=1115757 RepID=UPI0018E82B21|nr:DNA repair protein RecO [Leptolyngbya sp. BL0902]QQE65199.1 DNA repair protein RecO [Leptolyngbya sp. BL0902]